MAAARTTSVQAFTRQRPSRQPFPEHLPRERVVIAAPAACPCCGGGRLSKLGEDVTETLEVVPRQWKVIATVRERFSCRDCQTVTQPPTPFHVTARSWAGPALLAMIAFEKLADVAESARRAARGKPAVRPAFRPLERLSQSRALRYSPDAYDQTQHPELSSVLGSGLNKVVEPSAAEAGGPDMIRPAGAQAHA